MRVYDLYMVDKDTSPSIAITYMSAFICQNKAMCAYVRAVGLFHCLSVRF